MFPMGNAAFALAKPTSWNCAVLGKCQYMRRKCTFQFATHLESVNSVSNKKDSVARSTVWIAARLTKSHEGVVVWNYQWRILDGDIDSARRVFWTEDLDVRSRSTQWLNK